MTTKKTLARLQRAEQRALAHWLEITGTTRAELIAEIRRSQNGSNPAEGMGLDAAIACRVVPGPRLNSHAALLVLRAMLMCRQLATPAFASLCRAFGRVACRRVIAM
jgi:hypothetical protein